MGKAIVSRRRFLIAASSVTAAAGLPIQTQAQAPIVMKLGIGTINDVQHEWMKLYTAAVERDSGGRIKGEMYPANQLGQRSARSKARSSDRSKVIAPLPNSLPASIRATKC